MLNCSGRKPGARPLGSSTRRKSDGAPMVGLRLALLLVAELARVDALEARVRLSAIHWLGRLVRETGRTFSKSKTGADAGLGCSWQMSVYLRRAAEVLGNSPEQVGSTHSVVPIHADPAAKESNK